MKNYDNILSDTNNKVMTNISNVKTTQIKKDMFGNNFHEFSEGYVGKEYILATKDIEKAISYEIDVNLTDQEALELMKELDEDEYIKLSAIVKDVVKIYATEKDNIDFSAEYLGYEFKNNVEF